MKSTGAQPRGLPERLRNALRVVLALAALAPAGCRDIDVVTETYASLEEAVRAGAVERGWIPRGLPPRSYELREAHDLDSNRRWGLFNFPLDEADRLQALLAGELSLDGHTCTPPRRIEWWPLLLRQQLNQERIVATGLRAYESKEGGLIFAVNWSQGRAYYWTKE